MPTDQYKIQEVELDDELNFPVIKEYTPEQQALIDSSPIHYNLRTLSYSGISTLHSCPRKFELQRLMPRVIYQDDEGGHLSFGTIVGNGIQEFLVTNSLDRAIFRAFLDWKENIDEDKAERSGKTFWDGIHAIQKFVDFRRTILSAYEVAYFNGKPAVELGFDIDFGEGFHYRGKLDALLIHKTKREFLVLECKTTGLRYVDEALYKNSNQALGYGLIIDKVAFDLGMSNSYNVLYPVYMTAFREWKDFLFPKTAVQRAAWLQSLLIECSHITQYAALNYFPTHGESCFHFNKQCTYFGMCTLSNDTLFKDKEVEIKFDKEEEYPFKFNIQELIDAQVEK